MSVEHPRLSRATLASARSGIQLPAYDRDRLRPGIVHLGRGRIFCGIGACQGCLVAMTGAAAVEACLTPARNGLRLSPLAEEQADHD